MEQHLNTNTSYNPKSATKVFHLSWYKDQMSGWSQMSYILLVIGIAIQLYIGLRNGITPLGVTSTIAGIIGFTCTISITNGRPINGILGFISAIMLIYVASVTKNYSDIIMQLSYIILLDLPILFSHEWSSDFTPKFLKGKYLVQAIFTFAIFLTLTYLLDTVILHSPQAILDAVSASIGLTGAILTVRRFRASYYFWFAQGVMSVLLWVQTALNGHAVWVLMATYMLYIANDMIAFFDKKVKWFAKDKKQKQIEED